MVIFQFAMEQITRGYHLQPSNDPRKSMVKIPTARNKFGGNQDAQSAPNYTSWFMNPLQVRVIVGTTKKYRRYNKKILKIIKREPAHRLPVLLP